MSKIDVKIDLSSDVIKEMREYCKENNLTESEFIEQVLREDLYK